MKELWRTCESCQRVVPEGELYFALCLYKETFEGDGVAVYHAEYVLLWCRECAAKLDFRSITVLSKTEENDQEKK